MRAAEDGRKRPAVRVGDARGEHPRIAGAAEGSERLAEAVRARAGEVSASFVPPSTARAVVAECPLCLWRSAEVSVRDEVNAQWHARQEAATQYRDHFDVHRPLPRFVRIEAT